MPPQPAYGRTDEMSGTEPGEVEGQAFAKDRCAPVHRLAVVLLPAGCTLSCSNNAVLAERGVVKRNEGGTNGRWLRRATETCASAVTNCVV